MRNYMYIATFCVPNVAWNAAECDKMSCLML